MHHLLMEFSSRSDDDTPTKWDYFEIMSFIEILPQQVHKLIRQKKRFFVDPVCTKLIRKNTFSVIPLVHKLCDEKHSSVLPYEQTCTLKRYFFNTPIHILLRPFNASVYILKTDFCYYIQHLQRLFSS